MRRVSTICLIVASLLFTQFASHAGDARALHRNDADRIDAMIHVYDRPDAPGISVIRFLEESIFQPLGMSSTVAYEPGISTVKNRAYGYTPSGKTFRRTDQDLTSATLGDGGIYSDESKRRRTR